jgi:hypothetical protein
MPHRRPERTIGRPSLGSEPVTVAAARAAGWTRSAQQHAVAVGDLVRLRQGVLGLPTVVDASLPERRILEAGNLRAARAATLTCRRSAISHRPAAITWGMPTLGDLSRPCLTVAAGTALRHLAGVHLHRATLPEEDVRDCGGYPVLAPARTVMDIAREQGLTAGVVAADYALRHGLVDASALATSYELCARWPGRKAARMTLLLADARSESVLESLSRLRMLAHGLPVPALQIDICDEHGRFLGRSDFYWEEFGVVGEADGNAKYAAGAPVITAEKTRHTEFEETGLIVVRWGWSDLFAFDAVARRLRTAFQRGAGKGSALRRWGVALPRPG